MNRTATVVFIILFVLTLDQSLKFWIKLNMEYGEEIPLLGLSWARLHFVENEGMAFGIKLGKEYGKLVLSLVRLVAIGFLIHFIKQFLLKKASLFVLVSFSLILAGAIGNILDSAFYGLIFSNSSYHGGVATLFPETGGYERFLYGRVVDMFYFPVYAGHFPDWFPMWSGEEFLFFRPVFNIADIAITTGVLSILIFQRNIFTESFQEAPVANASTNMVDLPETGSISSPETKPESNPDIKTEE